MRAVLAAAVLWVGATGAAAAEMREVAPAAYAAAHKRNAFAAEAELTGKPFRFVGVPVQVGRGPRGLPMVHYAVEGWPGRVQAILAPDAAVKSETLVSPEAAGIEVGRRIALVCDAAGSDLFPRVSGCRPEQPAAAKAKP